MVNLQILNFIASVIYTTDGKFLLGSLIDLNKFSFNSAVYARSGRCKLQPQIKAELHCKIIKINFSDPA
jgi:hypothetical protein